MWGIVKIVGSFVFSLKGAAAAAGAYIWSASEKDESKQVFKPFVDKTVLPAAGGIFEKLSTGVSNIFKDVTGNKAASNALKGAADATESGLDAAGNLLQQVPDAAGKAGEAVGATTNTMWDSAGKFVDGILPKNASGWMKNAAILAVGALGIAGGGSMLGSKTVNFQNLFRFAMMPFNAVGGAFTTALSGVTGMAVTVAACLAIVGLCIPSVRNGVWNSVTGFFNQKGGGKDGHSAPSQEHTQPIAQTQPERMQNNQQRVDGVDLNGMNLAGVSGGQDATDIRNSMRGAEIPGARDRNPRGGVNPAMGGS